VPLIHLSNGKAFAANDDEVILDAGLRAGVTLPYSCRTGRCSTCRCRVSAGTTVALHAETGLTPAEQAEGWVLGCVRSATSDVTLEVEDLGDVPPARTLACRIHAIERPAADVMRIMLRLPPTAEFDYHPGQYVDVIGAGGIRRSYSIANAVSADKRIELHVRQVEDGVMSAFWFNEARQNDLLRLHGPLGTFFLRDIAGLDLVFLATGTGIAPVKAILEGLAALPAAKAPRTITVYWGGRHPADLYWTPDAAMGHVGFVRVLSRADEQWEGARGHVQDVFAATSPDLSRTAVYACGSDAMIHAAHRRLVDAGLPERRFSSDAFVCSAAV
jgi:CDP-4-dehydro-6-deoxyglucose reductase, E3